MSGFVTVAKVSDVKPGTLKSFDVGSTRILIANWEGTFFATQDLCTHDDGTLGDGELIAGEIECPRHGGRFDVKTGAVTALPPMFPIKTFAVKVEGDDVLVAVEQFTRLVQRQTAEGLAQCLWTLFFQDLRDQLGDLGAGFFERFFAESSRDIVLANFAIH